VLPPRFAAGLLVDAAHIPIASYPGRQQLMLEFGQQRFWASVTQSSVQAPEQQLGNAAHTVATQGSQPVVHSAGPGVQISWH